MFAQTEWVNRTLGYGLGNSGVFETFTDKKADLFKSLQKEYGRCVSKIYFDKDDKPIGWVFQSKRKYEDVNESYILETWVTLHDQEPEKITKYHYHTI